MKASKLFFLSVFYLLLSCSDNVNLKESDLQGYPWLMPFINDNIGEFEGKHNIDLGTLEFSYKIPDSINGLSSFDAIAYKEQWKITNKSLLKRSFSKAVNDGLRDRTIITIRIDAVEHRVHFNVD